MSSEIPVGFFGKIPTLGDFVERRIHPGFRSLWDQWLEDGLTSSRDELGDRWLDLYLVSPIWRFVLSAGIAGEAVYAGVMVPSVDRVGRYFPLTVVAALPAETSCLGLFAAGTRWFKSVESVLLDILEGALTEVDDIDRALCDLEQPLADIAADLPARMDLSKLDFVLLLDEAQGVAQGLAPLIESLLQERAGSPSYWLAEESAEMPPRLLVVQGLPPPTSFAALLGHAFEPAAWQIVPSSSGVAYRAASTANSTCACSSSMRTDRGHVRARNEDYAISRPDLKLWAVADGMGGYEDGALASAAVCEALECVAWQGSLENRANLALAALRGVNATLREQARTLARAISSASTVVALLLDGDKWSCVWSGDSRLYRLRSDTLEQLSRDHSTGEHSQTDAQAEEYFVTAGVGVEDELVADVFYGDVRPGDRFLLCSDGLYDALDASVIKEGLGQAETRVATHHLLTQVLAGPAADNATAVVVYIT